MVQHGRVVQGHHTGEKSLFLTESQRFEIQQYEKIARFQESVLSGNHPTVKIPAHLTASAQPSKHAIDSITKPGATARQLGNSQSFSENARHPAVSVGSVQSSPAAAAKPSGPKKGAIKAILLQKSEELVRAEIQLKRQKVERALREEVEHRRAAAKAAAQGEPIADFDLSEVLSKALTLVQTPAAASPAAAFPADENAGSANRESSSDSFDNNTFYSSEHFTPEQVLVSRVRNESEDVPLPEAHESQQPTAVRNVPPSHGPPVQTKPASITPQSQTHSKTALSTTNNTVGIRPQLGQGSGSNSQVEVRLISSGPSQNTSAVQSQSDESGNMEVDQFEGTYRADPRQRPSDPYHDRHPPSPLMRPQHPSVPDQSFRVSPLVATRRPAVAAEVVSASTGTPAQVAALRNEPAAGTSPESSPQGGKQAEKRKGKKKKRKADRQAPEAEAPYIKPEPLSPSPMNAPSYIRPNKRQRQSQRQANDLGYDDVRYDPQRSSAIQEVYPGHVPRDERAPVAYGRADVYPQGAVSAAVAPPVYGREYAEERFVSNGPYLVAHSPSHHEHRPRSISSQVYAERYPRSSWSYQESYEPPAARRENDAYMAPSRPAPTRIIVDAFGREYIEPPRPPIIQHSATPHGRSDEPEIIYERPAPRPASRHLPVDTYEQGGSIYRRPSPSYISRRVVTQPEYASQEYRDSRPREYSSRPMASSNEYVEVMAPPERRHLEERPREYIQRSSSVRPAEPIRYEAPRDYTRVQSVRPEGQLRQYATGAHTDAPREAAQPYIRDYPPRPAEATVMRRDYAPRPPVERYYEQQPIRGEDIAFIERPRGATQEIVYADDARRELYR